jgi:hypothetical protein
LGWVDEVRWAWLLPKIAFIVSIVIVFGHWVHAGFDKNVTVDYQAATFFLLITWLTTEALEILAKLKDKFPTGMPQTEQQHIGGVNTELRWVHPHISCS